MLGAVANTAKATTVTALIPDEIWDESGTYTYSWYVPMSDNHTITFDLANATFGANGYFEVTLHDSYTFNATQDLADNETYVRLFAQFATSPINVQLVTVQNETLQFIEAPSPSTPQDLRIFGYYSQTTDYLAFIVNETDAMLNEAVASASTVDAFYVPFDWVPKYLTITITDLTEGNITLSQNTQWTMLSNTGEITDTLARNMAILLPIVGLVAVLGVFLKKLK